MQTEDPIKEKETVEKTLGFWNWNPKNKEEFPSESAQGLLLETKSLNEYTKMNFKYEVYHFIEFVIRSQWQYMHVLVGSSKSMLQSNVPRQKKMFIAI